jgi:hypothetical protein
VPRGGADSEAAAAAANKVEWRRPSCAGKSFDLEVRTTSYLLEGGEKTGKTLTDIHHVICYLTYTYM